jgi:uncharacterized RDD family membrane protein YckC
MTERARAAALQGTRAGLVSRTVAGAIDIGVVFAMYWGALIAIAAVEYVLFEDPFEVPKPGAAAGSTTLLALLIVVFTIAWSGSGRTVGNGVVGLRVVTERGTPPGWARALVRACFLVVLVVPAMLWILVSRKNAGLHDLLCRTAVIYDWRPRREALDPALVQSRQDR